MIFGCQLLIVGRGRRKEKKRKEKERRKKMIKKCVESDDMGYFHVATWKKKEKEKKSEQRRDVYVRISSARWRERNEILSTGILTRSYPPISSTRKNSADVQRGLLIGVQRLISRNSYLKKLIFLKRCNVFFFFFIRQLILSIISR